MSGRLGPAVLLVSLFLQACATRPPPELAPGVRARVSTVDGRAVTGSIVQAGADTLRVAPTSGPLVVVTLASLERIAVSVGEGPSTGRGAWLGAAGGALGFGLLAAVLWEEPTCRGSLGGCQGFGLSDGSSRTGDVLLNAVVGAVVGTVVGAFVGSRVHTERWMGVPLDRVRARRGTEGVRASR